MQQLPEQDRELRARLTRQFSPMLELRSDGATILGIRFPVVEHGARVPDLGLFRRDALTQYDFQLMRKIAIGIDLNIPMLIEGGSGIGKSQAAERVCALLQRDCYYANCHDFSADILIGTMSVKAGTKTGFGWVDGIAVQAIRNGGVLFLDEYNFMLGETRGRLHEILDAVLRGKDEIILVENGSERVKVHPDFRIIAAQNPPGEGFSDRYFLDAAQISRFQYCKEPTGLPEQLKLARTLQSLGLEVCPEVDPSLFLSTDKAISREALLKQPNMADFLYRFADFHDQLEQKIFNRDLAADQSQPLYLAFQRELNRVLHFMSHYWQGSVNQSAELALSFVYESMFETLADKATVRNLIMRTCGGLSVKIAEDFEGTPIGTKNGERGIVENGEHVEICGVKLPKGNGGPRTPDKAKFEKNCLTAYDRAALQKVAIAVALNQALLIEGGSGLGKSERVEWICALLNRECYYANCQDFTADVLIGSMLPREDTKSGFGWVDGVVISSIRNGGILFLDEYNFMNGETRGRLHEILDAILRGNRSVVLAENGGEVVPVHPDFRIIAAQNPPGDLFLDRLILDPAQITRFLYIKEPSQMPLSLKRARGLALAGIELHGDLPKDEQMWPGHQQLTMQELQQTPGAVELLGPKFVQFHKAITSVVNNENLAEFQPQPVSFAFQRDFDRLVQYITTFHDGDLNSTMRSALMLYFMSRFDSDGDRAKVREMMSHVRAMPKADRRREVITEVSNASIDALEIQGIPFLEDLVSRGLSPKDLLTAIAGFASDNAHNWRKTYWRTDPDLVMASLAGVDDERSIRLREEILGISNRNDISRRLEASLVGLDSFTVNELRTKFRTSPTIKSISGLDTALAHEVRDGFTKRMSNDVDRIGSGARDVGDPFASLVMSYTGLDTPEARKIRDRALRIPGRRGVFIQSLAFIDDYEYEFYRQPLLQKTEMRDALLEGFAGVDSLISWQLRKKVLEDTEHLPEHLEALCKSLAGLTSQKAWQMRKELLDAATSPEQLGHVALSLTGGPFLAGIRRARLDRELTLLQFVKLD